VLGAISQVTERLQLVTGVTCPTTRIHPAIIAQAAATAASLLPGRFSLGVGSGENLNEHILGDSWPAVPERQDRLGEAIDVIRKLWEGELTTYRGRHYTVENARLYSLPDELPPILVAIAGERSVELAIRTADGLIGTAPVAESVERFREGAGAEKPAYGQLHVCWAADEDSAARTALEHWPNGAISGSYFLELPIPSHFEEASELVDEKAIRENIVCGPTQSVTSGQSASTSTLATTTSTSTRWDPTKTASSTSTSAKYCQSFPWANDAPKTLEDSASRR
jgi:G6PDH family F420-dependent oxidoreductase